MRSTDAGAQREQISRARSSPDNVDLARHCLCDLALRWLVLFGPLFNELDQARDQLVAVCRSCSVRRADALSALL